MPRQLIILLIVLGLLGGGIYYHQSQQQTTKVDAEQVELLLPQLSKSVSITDISIMRGQQQLAKFKLENEQWLAYHLSDEHSIKVDTTPLFALVRDLSAAKIVEKKSDKPINHERLGLDYGDASSQAMYISINADGTLFEVLIGDEAELQDGHFVRLANDDQMLLVDKVFSLPNTESEWLAKDMLPINADDIQSVSRISDDDIMWKLVSTATDSSKNVSAQANPEQLVFEGTNFALSDLGNEEKLAYPMVVANYISTLSNLNFETIAEFNQAQWQEAEQAASILIEASINKQAQRLRMNIASKDGRHWVHVVIEGNSSDEQINALSHWMFEIAQFRADSLLKERVDFLQTKKANTAKEE